MGELFEDYAQNLGKDDQKLQLLSREIGINFADLKDMRRKFDRLDEDGSGELDKSEFLLLVRSMLPPGAPDPRQAQLQDWWNAIDEDESGFISFREFAIFWADEML